MAAEFVLSVDIDFCGKGFRERGERNRLELRKLLMLNHFQKCDHATRVLKKDLHRGRAVIPDHCVSMAACTLGTPLGLAKAPFETRSIAGDTCKLGNLV